MSRNLSATERLSKIESLLERERAEMRAGRFAALERLIGEREAHVAQLQGSLEASDRDALEFLRRIQSKARANARLLGAARDGFEAGSTRLAEITAVQERLSTYSEDGRLANIMEAKSQIEKRA